MNSTPLPHDHAQRVDAQVDLYLKLMGYYLNHLRIELAFSQEHVACVACVSRTEVYNVEHGLTNERVGTLKRICIALHVSYGEVVTHTDFLMEHPEFRPQKLVLKSLRGKKVNRPL